MSSLANLLLLVGCAALLQGACEAKHSFRGHRRSHGNRRNLNDKSISLGTIQGSDIITLPVIHLQGPDVIVGFPDNCANKGLVLSGTEMIVSNSNQGVPVDLVADDADNPQSIVVIHCNADHGILRCVDGIDVTSYQYCGGPLPPPTTTTDVPSSTTTEVPSSSTTEEPSSTPPDSQE